MKWGPTMHVRISTTPCFLVPSPHQSPSLLFSLSLLSSLLLFLLLLLLMREVNKRQGGGSPCAACKLLRRRCAEDCVFAPYFPADQPHKFASVHKVFGASNVNKLLQELPAHHRSDAVSSMVYEANARVRDPVYGCVGAISSLQQQVDALQTQLAIAQAEMLHIRMSHAAYLARLGLTPVMSGSGGSSSGTSSPKLMEMNEKPAYGLEMVVDQSNLDEPLWPC